MLASKHWQARTHDNAKAGELHCRGGKSRKSKASAPCKQRPVGFCQWGNLRQLLRPCSEPYPRQNNSGERW